MTGYSTFEDWFAEQEGFSVRAERFDGDVAWLKAAFEAGRSKPVEPALSVADQEPVAMIVRIDGEDEITWLEGGPAIGPGDYLYASPQPSAVITEDMVERAYDAFVAACEWSDWDEPEVRGYVRAALEAAMKEA